MIAIDTNVLVQILVNDKQAKQQQLTLHTFDKKLSRLQGAKLITDKD